MKEEVNRFKGGISVVIAKNDEYIQRICQLQKEMKVLRDDKERVHQTTVQTHMVTITKSESEVRQNKEHYDVQTAGIICHTYKSVHTIYEHL